MTGEHGRCAAVGCENDWVYRVKVRYDGMDFAMLVCFQCGIAIDKLEVVAL